MGGQAREERSARRLSAAVTSTGSMSTPVTEAASKSKAGKSISVRWSNSRLQCKQGDPSSLTKLARHVSSVAANVEARLGLEESWDQALKQDQTGIADMRGGRGTWELTRRTLIICGQGPDVVSVRLHLPREEGLENECR